MSTIMLNSFREKIRSKVIYIVGAIGVLIVTFLMLNADFTMDNRKFVTFEELVPIAIIMVNFVASILAIMLSLQTIPNEFERKTTHLVLVRGIKKYEYMLELTLSNILVSLISLCILYSSIIIFCVVHNKFSRIFNIFGSMGILSINITLISAITSFLSIEIPLFLNGILGIMIYFLGVFHNIFSVIAKSIGGVYGKVLDSMIFIIPNFNAVQKQAGNLVSGKMVDFYPLVVQMVVIYIFITLIMFTFRKEV